MTVFLDSNILYPTDCTSISTLQVFQRLHNSLTKVTTNTSKDMNRYEIGCWESLSNWSSWLTKHETEVKDWIQSQSSLALQFHCKTSGHRQFLIIMRN